MVAEDNEVRALSCSFSVIVAKTRELLYAMVDEALSKLN